MTWWKSLGEELDLWRHAGRAATLWWRDDDLVEPTPALDQLLALHAEVQAPLTLAVIPARMEKGLASVLANATDVAVVQHGYAHANYSPDAHKKSELGPDRPVGETTRELTRGKSILAGIFGARPLPILVPPWNRIDPAVVALLASLGYTGLSTFTARKSREAAPGVVQVNTHVDIIDWLGSRGFVGEPTAVGSAVTHLAARRTGAVDPDEPTGLLTHHLAHDEACAAFVRRFVAATTAHGARWLSAREAFCL